MLISKNIKKFFQYEKDELIATLIAAVIFVFRNHDKNTILLDEILENSDINLESPLFLQELEDQLEDISKLEDNSLYYEHELRHSPSILQDSTITWPYYAIYFAFNLKNEDIFLSRNDPILNNLLNMSLNYHNNFLKYKKFEERQKEQQKQQDDFYKNISIGVVRSLEYLAKFYLYKNEYLFNTYLNIEGDLFENIVELSNNDIVERDCFFIVKDPSGTNFFKYENIELEIHYQILSSRKIGKGSDTNQQLNRKITLYLSKAYDNYIKLINLELKKEKGKKEGYSVTKNILQATEEEKYIEEQTQLTIPNNIEQTHEQNQRLTKKARVSLYDGTSKNIGNKYNQHKKNIAFSASVTKNKLLLSTDYRIPELVHLKSFIQYLCKGQNQSFDNIYNYSKGVFILSVIFGFSIDDLILFLHNEHTVIKQLQKGKISVSLDSKLFAIYKNNTYLEKTGQNIRYNLQDYVYSLINKLTQYIVIYSNSYYFFSKLNWQSLSNVAIIKTIRIDCKPISKKNRLEQFTLFKEDYYKSMKNLINDYNKTIVLDLKRLWKIPLKFKKILFNDDTIAMLAIAKYQKNDAAKLSYTSTDNFSQKYSIYIEKICNLLGLNEGIKNLINIEHKILGNTYLTTESTYSGSHRALKYDIGEIFFKKMYQLILNEENEHNRFNLVSIYIRYAMSILCCTRDLKKSSTIQNISFLMHTQMVTEKSDSQLSGVRIIPLCSTIESLIKYYQSSYKNLKYISLYKNEQFIKFNVKDAHFLMKEITNDTWLHGFIKYVPLNVGRHIISQYKIEKNFNSIYIEAFLGHYISGAEQFGIYSPLDIPSYIYYIREKMENIAHLYGIEKL